MKTGSSNSSIAAFFCCAWQKMPEEPGTSSLALWTPVSSHGVSIEFILWNWDGVVQFLSREGSHLGRTAPPWAEREVHPGTVGYCDISSDGLWVFYCWPLSASCYLLQAHSSTMSVKQLKSADPHGPWGDRLALVNIAIFYLEGDPPQSYFLLWSGYWCPIPWGFSLCPD